MDAHISVKIVARGGVRVALICTKVCANASVPIFARLREKSYDRQVKGTYGQ